MSMPSDGFTFDELREEYDWMSDFMGRMAERIRGNPDVSSLAAYVAKLEAENAKLRELAERAWKSAERLCQTFDGPCRDDGVTIAKPCPMGERDEECVYGQLQRELRECGVEVDA